jgi:hypothetical protein
MLLRRQENQVYNIFMGVYSAKYGSQGERQRATYRCKQVSPLAIQYAVKKAGESSI